MLRLLVLFLGVLLASGRPSEHHDAEGHQDQGHHEQEHGKGSSSGKDQVRPGQCPAAADALIGLNTLSAPSPDCANGTNCTSSGTLPTSTPDCANVTAHSCSIDSTCPQAQKCCPTICDARCLEPVPDKVCQSDADCAANAGECCKAGTCCSDCTTEEEEDEEDEEDEEK